MKKLGDVLRELRHEKRLSFQSVSQETGIRIDRIHEYENHLKKPNDEVIEKLATVYGEDPERLKKIREEGEEL